MRWMDCGTASAGCLEFSHHAVAQGMLEVVEVARELGGGRGPANTGRQGVEQGSSAVGENLVIQADAVLSQHRLEGIPSVRRSSRVLR